MKIHNRFREWYLLCALGMLCAAAARSQANDIVQAAESNAARCANPFAASPKPGAGLEPRAIEILRATSNRLAAARAMSFTAIVTSENPSRFGSPVQCTVRSEVTVQRPDKLRVITEADDSASEFYYDGKTMTSFAPSENTVAMAAAPATLESALDAAYQSAGIYFPFGDLIVADPYGDMVKGGLTQAFYVGQSKLVGGVTTDIVAYVTGGVFLQIWIGVDDKLPRMLNAVYLNDPLQLRHRLDLSDWKLDPSLPAGAFTWTGAAGASRIRFARPGVTAAPAE